MKVQVEMGPKEFTLTPRVGGFIVGEDLTIALENGGALDGRVEDTKDAVYGVDQTPCTRIKIAITSKNIVQHKNQYLRRATVTGKRSRAVSQIYGRDMNKYTHPMIKQKYVADIVREIETLLKRASTIKDDDKAKQWFGDDLGPARLQRIHCDIAAMHQGLLAVATMHFVCTTGIYLAAADLDNRVKYKPTGCQVLLGKGFTFERYSWGEKVCTLAHELSHWFLSTTDETYQGEDAYGIKAFDMAVDPNENERRKCLKNAENWGFYICSYRSSGDGKDWSNMTRDELEGRAAFELSSQTVSSSVVHLS